MTNLEKLKDMLNRDEDYDVSDIADFLTYSILDTGCENFDDIKRELLDNYLE